MVELSDVWRQMSVSQKRRTMLSGGLMVWAGILIVSISVTLYC